MNEVERAIEFGVWLTGHDEDTIWQMYEDYYKGERRALLSEAVTTECVHGELLKGLCNACADKYGVNRRLINVGG